MIKSQSSVRVLFALGLAGLVSAPAVAAPFKALALAWNSSGAYAVRSAQTLDDAENFALQVCGPDCVLGGTVNTFTFGCIAVAQQQGTANLSEHAGPTNAEAFNVALNNCNQQYGGNCTIVGIACNN